MSYRSNIKKPWGGGVEAPTGLKIGDQIIAKTRIH